MKSNPRPISLWMTFSVALAFAFFQAVSFANAEDVEVFRIDEGDGKDLQRATFWYRGEQCLACVRSYRNKGELRFREFADIFSNQNRIATFDMKEGAIAYLMAPPGRSFDTLSASFTGKGDIEFYSKDYSRFERITVVDRVDGAKVYVLGNLELEQTKKALLETRKNPSLSLGTAAKAPLSVPPQLEEAKKRAASKSNTGDLERYEIVDEQPIGSSPFRYFVTSNYWFRGSKCVACLWGNRHSASHVSLFRSWRAYFFYGEQFCVKIDMDFTHGVGLNLPADIGFEKIGNRVRIFSKDLSYFEEAIIMPQQARTHPDLVFRNPEELEAARQAFREGKASSPKEDGILREYTPIEKAPTLEEIKKRGQRVKIEN